MGFFFNFLNTNDKVSSYSIKHVFFFKVFITKTKTKTQIIHTKKIWKMFQQGINEEKLEKKNSKRESIYEYGR